MRVPNMTRDVMKERDWIAKIIWEASRADEGTISATGANIIANALLAHEAGDVTMLMADLTAAWETIERVENCLLADTWVSRFALEDALWGDHGNE